MIERGVVAFPLLSVSQVCGTLHVAGSRWTNLSSPWEQRCMLPLLCGGWKLQPRQPQTAEMSCDTTPRNVPGLSDNASSKAADHRHCHLSARCSAVVGNCSIWQPPTAEVHCDTTPLGLLPGVRQSSDTSNHSAGWLTVGTTLEACHGLSGHCRLDPQQLQCTHVDNPSICHFNMVHTKAPSL